MAGTNDQIGMRLDNYPGGFVAEAPHKYLFPTVRYLNRQGSAIESTIEICGAYGTALQATQTNPQFRALTAQMFDEDPVEPLYCLLSVITKNKNESRGQPTLITQGKNLDKINRTTIFHQALIEGYSHYKKLATGNKRIAVDSPHLLDRKSNSVSLAIRNTRGMIPPMLACAEVPAEWYAQRIGMVGIQPKYDGTRAIITGAVRRDSDSAGIRPLCYSRGMIELPYKSFMREMEIIIADYPDLYFDGEIYAHGMSLQQISGSVRNTGKHSQSALDCNFMIFDVFRIDEAGAPVRECYLERYKSYQTIATRYREAGVEFTYIRFVNLIFPKSFEHTVSIYRSCLTEGYEGLMLKDLRGYYDPSYNGYHSSLLCKMKDRKSAEFRCVGWNEGQGKFTGMLASWTVEVTAKSVTGEAKTDAMLARGIGKQFNCTPKCVDAQKRTWFEDIRSSGFAMFAGVPCTVEFFDVSDDGIPTQPFWVAFRDYEGESVDLKGIENDS